MLNEDVAAVILFIGLIISAVIGGITYEWNAYHHGADSYHVKNTILTYRIITNTTCSYKNIYKLFSKSKTFEQLTNGSRLIEARGYKDNLLSIIEELKTLDEIDKSTKKDLAMVTPELVNMVDVARKVKRLKCRCP